ncbi:variant erythrocyte surface antigen-1 family protein [Babesia caballi]|uniref:Variant erythrocyte surface antigen-1 family protein n=1 Tax=Babesia caballi TaxID=5871 RepID=A0AAV4LR12_BABCB|nr:variant erythrocyte surface antigen-1 family protein [Babesia caballi]
MRHSPLSVPVDLPFDSPSNLKEAIDWILRVTGKDGGQGGDGTSHLAKAVQELLNTAEVKDINSTITRPLIDNLATGLATFIGYENGGGNIGNGGIAAKPTNKSGGNKGSDPKPFKSSEMSNYKAGYVYSYEPENATWGKEWSHSSHADAQKCAKIFLSCLPMIFSALSYLYWKSRQPVNQGGWINMQFSNQNDPLGSFMLSNGFTSKQLSGYVGRTVLGTAYEKFKDFSDGLTKAKKSAEQRAKKEDAAKITLKVGKSHTPGQPSQPVSADKNPTYPEYLHELCENGQEKSNIIPTNAEQNSLSILFHISYLYFKGKQSALSESPRFKPRPPSTIREMLYFFATLPYSPSYDSLSSYITEHFRKLVNNKSVNEDHELMIPVADSSSPNTNNTLSAADLKNYLTTTCLYCPTILGRFQGNSADSGDEPWLHSLFSNSQFFLAYPAGAPLLKVIANYTYALQFQLSFLYQQCSLGSTQGCRWRQCKYGQSINIHSNGQIIQSHICPVKCIKNRDEHDTSNHTKGGACEHKKCGESTNLSPLQAFLTDSLSGFSVSQNPDLTSLTHLENHPPGYMCHVKMGFQPTDLRSSGSGHYIYYTLDQFCGYTYAPLPQLSEKLGCLTKRTPRTLSDVFGFIWHLSGQLFKHERPKLKTIIEKFICAFDLSNQDLTQKFDNYPYAVVTAIWNKISTIKSNPAASGSPTPSVFSKSLESMAPAIPFLYHLFMAEEPNTLPGALFDLTQHCHKWEVNQYKHESDPNSSIPNHQCTTHPADLWSLYHPVGPAPSGRQDTQEACRDSNCGGYLEPLTLNYGAAFSPSSAPAYLSWIAYLTDDLYERLSEMLNEFNNISCDNCKNSCQNEKSCHATSGSECNCTSVVSCAGVLPLLYRHGFQFYDAYSLNGWKSESGWQRDNNIKRTCAKFSQQLSNVLSPDAPLAKLLETIDSFLYMFRYYFFYNLTSFWLFSLAILLYFIFYGIDVLHVKSHVHFPSSHTVPPLRLLTAGKAPALTKLTYYMP